MSRLRVLLITMVFPALAGPALAQVPYGDNTEAGHYLQVGDARIYYERYGKGPPVLLLHGGLFGSIGEFADVIQDLQRDHSVIAMALRGHGHSELGSGSLSHQRMADDAAEILQQEATGPVDVVGFSSGAIAAYRFTLTHPEMVRRMVAIGGPIARSGYSESGKAEVEIYSSPAELERRYPALVRARKQQYRDPADWDRLVRAFDRIMRKEPDIPRSGIKHIAQPSLIVAGDRDDYTRLEHFVDIYQLLPHGSLAIVPGCGHLVLMCRPTMMKQLIRGFLEGS